MSERQPPAENKMGTMPVNRLLLSMAIPMMISMLVQALYNVVDSYFVAQISEDALNAVSLAFPVQNLMIAVAVGTGVGINALLSKSLGERRQRRANAAAMNGGYPQLPGVHGHRPDMLPVLFPGADRPAGHCGLRHGVHDHCLWTVGGPVRTDHL